MQLCINMAKAVNNIAVSTDKQCKVNVDIIPESHLQIDNITRRRRLLDASRLVCNNVAFLQFTLKESL